MDRGAAVAAALSTGELRRFDTGSLDAQVRRAQRKLCRAQRGSRRRGRVKARLARLHARQAFTRTDWVEKLSTELARRFDLIRVEDVRVTGLTRADLPNQAVAPYFLQSRTRRDGSRPAGRFGKPW